MNVPLRIAPLENKRSLALIWLMTLVWVGFCAVLLYIAFVRRGASSMPTWVLIVVVVMALIGLLLLFGMIHRTIGMAKYGKIELRLSAAPVIGGHLSGSMTLPATARSAGVLVAELACLHVRWQKTHDRKSSNRIEHALHRERREFPIQWAGDQGGVSLRFAIPEGLPHSDASEPDEDEDDPEQGFHSWQLEVHVDTAGVDLMRTYPLLVSRASQTPRSGF